MRPNERRCRFFHKKREERQGRILAIGIKEGNRLYLGGEKIEL
jgi:hypothetical protein